MRTDGPALHVCIGLVKTQLGLIWFPIKFNIFVSQFKTPILDLSSYACLGPNKMDQEATRLMKLTQIIDGLINHKIHEI